MPYAKCGEEVNAAGEQKLARLINVNRIEYLLRQDIYIIKDSVGTNFFDELLGNHTCKEALMQDEFFPHMVDPLDIIALSFCMHSSDVRCKRGGNPLSTQSNHEVTQRRNLLNNIHSMASAPGSFPAGNFPLVLAPSVAKAPCVRNDHFDGPPVTALIFKK